MFWLGLKSSVKCLTYIGSCEGRCDFCWEIFMTGKYANSLSLTHTRAHVACACKLQTRKPISIYSSHVQLSSTSLHISEWLRFVIKTMLLFLQKQFFLFKKTVDFVFFDVSFGFFYLVYESFCRLRMLFHTMIFLWLISMLCFNLRTSWKTLETAMKVISSSKYSRYGSFLYHCFVKFCISDLLLHTSNICHVKLQLTFTLSFLILERDNISLLPLPLTRIEYFSLSLTSFQIIQRFVIVDLSNFYFDIAKDRLYVG